MSTPQQIWEIGPSPSAVRPTLKRVTMPIGGDGHASENVSNICQRSPVLLPVTTTRWRLRIANLPSTGAKEGPNGAISYTGVWLGVPSIDITGQWGGALTVAPTQVFGEFSTPESGEDYISPWVSTPALQFQANVFSVISLGWTCPVGTKIYKGENRNGRSWNEVAANPASQAGNAAKPTGTTTPSVGYLDTRIEYETYTTYPVVLCIGDSLTAGYVNPTAEPYLAALPGPHASWPGQAGLQNHMLIINGGVGAATYATAFSSNENWALKRFNLSTTVPDAMVLACGVNEAAAGTEMETQRKELVACINRLKELGIKRVFLCTVMSQPDAVAYKEAIMWEGCKAAATKIKTTVAYAKNDVITLGFGYGAQEDVTAKEPSVEGLGFFETELSAGTTNAHRAGEPTGIRGEKRRQEYNQQIRRGIGGSEGVFDFANVIPPVEAPPFWNGKEVHPGVGAYSQFGALVKIPY